MASKKNYYGLDDVGFVGVAKERSAAEIKSDAKRTSKYIKNYRSASKSLTKSAVQPKQSSKAKGRFSAAASPKKKSTVKAK